MSLRVQFLGPTARALFDIPCQLLWHCDYGLLWFSNLQVASWKPEGGQRAWADCGRDHRRQHPAEDTKQFFVQNPSYWHIINSHQIIQNHPWLDLKIIHGPKLLQSTTLVPRNDMKIMSDELRKVLRDVEVGTRGASSRVLHHRKSRPVMTAVW